MLGISISPCPAVQQWEDAHTCLLSAFTSYIDACTSLKDSSLANLTTSIEDLVPRIERHIASLGSFVACQVFQTQSILSTTRNQIASRIYALPEEVLVEIFTRVIYEPTENTPQSQSQSMEQELRAIYRRLYRLISVCSSWRDIAVRKGDFWSMVPMLETNGSSGQILDDVIERSIRRSCGAGLYIAMNTSRHIPTLLRPLINHENHIQALNIRTCSPCAVEEVMSSLAMELIPGVLSELSICMFGGGEDRILKDHFKHQEWFKKVLDSLRALRIRGAHIALYDVSFTNLVELRIEDICLGYKPLFKQLLRAISSASNLQYLHLANVTSYASQDPDNTPQDIVSDELSISLPNLKQVYLSGMWFNDLEAIFESIVPGNEKWILSLGYFSIEENIRYGHLIVDVQKLHLLLHGLNVDTLILNGRDGEGWLSGYELSQFLKSVTTITTLKMNGWSFYQHHWEGLARPQGLIARSNEFPCIRNLHIYSSKMHDEHGIQAVITSHNIRQLRLGLFIRKRDGYGYRALTDEDSFTTWLVSNVSDFQLIDLRERLPMVTDEWRLW